MKDNRLKEIPDKYDVFFNGVKAMRVNPSLVKRLKISDEKLDEIKRLHQMRLQTEQYMSNTDDPKKLKILFEQWSDCEFLLQDAWGFERNQNYHRFWDVPGCSCPKLDNEDAYPTGYYVINQSCPVHGENV